MTVIDEILICANKLANAGTKPTVALVKGKLTQRAPLAVIISTLKNWQHQPDFIAPAINEEQEVNDDLSTKNTSELLESLLENGVIKKVIQQSLAVELTELKKELAEMKLLINNLGEQLTKK
jgi:predicted transcriptional regulator